MLVLSEDVNNSEFRRFSRRIFFDFLVEEMRENLYFAENRPSFLLPEYVNNVNWKSEQPKQI